LRDSRYLTGAAAALLSLARGLPGHTRLRGYLRPANPEVDCTVNELHLRAATPDAGSDRTDDGSQRERRQLKHRAAGDSRLVPTHPELTKILRDHLAHFGTAPDGRLFSGVRGGLSKITTCRYQCRSQAQNQGFHTVGPYGGAVGLRLMGDRSTSVDLCHSF